MVDCGAGGMNRSRHLPDRTASKTRDRHPGEPRIDFALLGQEETTDIEERPVEETQNNSTPESTAEGSPSNENSGSPKEKNENLPEESTSSSFFSAYADEMMSEGGSSTPKPKLREDRTQTQMMIEISTAVLEEMEKKKNKGLKVAAPDLFEGDRKDTKRFLMEVEIYLRMHPNEYDNDEKKCLFLLSYMRGKNTESWKKTQSAKIFDQKSDQDELTFSKLKDEFKKHYLPADIQAEAQIKIEEAKMTDRADNYVNDFQVMADESGYDNQALIHIFRKGLPNSLLAKILNQLQGRLADLEGWYEAAIRYDKQYKYYEAVQKPKRFQIADDKKKKISINRISNQLSEEERKKYMTDGRCFQCAKQGHMSRDCPTKQGGETKEEKKKLSAREAYVKIRAIVGFLKWRKRLTLSPPPPISILNVVLAKQSQNSMHIPLAYDDEIEKVGTNALLDSGVGGLFMSPEKASKLGLERTKLPHRIKVFNVDGTANKMAWIMQSVTAQYTIGTKKMTDTFLISELGKEEVILGLPWLRKYNPEVDWITGRTTFPTKRYIKIPRVKGILDFKSPEELIHRIDIRAKLSTSQRLEHGTEQMNSDTPTTILEYLSQYQGQFEDKEAERFPIS
ncbi:hypothetical protein Moror_8150 [Moniliophthora roreri MCA 2997]|uniref:CCHC-type domain-containing protein n=1 Tax=Moniliophthora roreri (strain MCA 2997) TaxID=1381753 RepID=V2XL76_MONRO|nr:hypothetical protein Moror_8150 [Moniliophthora roreri MCA 2997]